VDGWGKVHQNKTIIDKDGGMQKNDPAFRYGAPNSQRCGELLPAQIVAIALVILRERVRRQQKLQQIWQKRREKTAQVDLHLQECEQHRHAPALDAVVFELGAGLGNVAAQLALHTGLKVVGIELRDAMFQLAKQYTSKVGHYLC
jgi:2-polyprenyl-3-methyl-5-hydroxy-6-metoxy-1,4-benzoquinol methylase